MGAWRMPDNKLIKSILGAQKAIDISSIEEATRASRSIADLRHSIGENSALMQAMESIRSNEELRRAGILDLDHARFKLPENAEMARLLATCKSGVLSNIMARFAGEYSSLKRAMEIMRTPWLNVQDPLHSMGGFAALQGIGHALKNMPAFGHALGAALRGNLGDWRDTITWPREIFTDLEAREDFYVGLGFDPALTDFPAPAFEESLHIADLCREPPPLVDLYRSPIPAADDDEGEEALARTNMAHGWLMSLETQVRRFIDEQMTKAFGDDWPKHRLPNKLCDKWQEKKQRAIRSGCREGTLITYADFTDYVSVICKRDNWGVFAPFFGRQESMRESFQRLYPIRLDTMHSRPITQDDKLLLYVETSRLWKMMAKRKV